MKKDCPKCHSNEIGPAGACLVCGYQIETEAPTGEPGRKESSGFSGMIEMNYSRSSRELAQEDELPRWRQELSQRLHDIKQRRDAAGEVKQPDDVEGVLPFPASQIPAVAQPAAGPAKPVEKTRVSKVAQSPFSERGAERPSGLRFTQTPQKETKEYRAPELFSVEPVPKIKDPDPEEIQSLIDSIMARQTARSIIPALRANNPSVFHEGKLILLSRILSGLIDLISILLCTGGFIIGADFFSGIVVLDSVSYAIYSLLFLLTYFLYSLFFLGTSNQTIGMMITDLRVVGADERRPLMLQLLGRCFGYLLSLLGLGIGLFWSLFDRESQCLHDRLSNTQIIRI